MFLYSIKISMLDMIAEKKLFFNVLVSSYVVSLVV